MFLIKRNFSLRSCINNNDDDDEDDDDDDR